MTQRVTELLAKAVAALGGAERRRPDRDGRGRRARVRHRRAPRRAGGHRAPASRWPTWCLRSRGPLDTTTARGGVDGDNRPAAPARRPRPAAAGRLPGRRPAPSTGVRALERARKLPVPQQDSQRHVQRPRTNPRTGRRRSCSSRWPRARSAATSQRLIAWSSNTDTGDRDDLTPGVPDRSWSQVSVSARECIGVARCPFGTDCFAEKARDKAGHADVVVTNHALLAIDAIADAAVLPEHDLLVVDEAHELVDRVTGVATAELSATSLGIAQRRAGRLVDPELAQRLEAATATFSSAIHDATPGRIDVLDDEMATYLTALRDAASRARSAIDTAPSDPKAASARAEAVDGADRHQRHRDPHPDLVRSRDRRPHRRRLARTHRGQPAAASARCLRVAPLSVAGLLRGRLFGRSTAVLTSATLTIGGTFDAMASAWGLEPGPERRGQVARHRRRLAVRPCEVGHPLRRRPSAAAGARRHRLGRAARRDRRADHRRGRANAGPVLVDARGQGRRRDHAGTARHPGAVPGRRHHLGAGAAVRRRRRDIAVRHAVAVAGRGRARARRCRWCSSTASRSRGPTTRC